jgi:hypothetical protein
MSKFIAFAERYRQSPFGGCPRAIGHLADMVIMFDLYYERASIAASGSLPGGPRLGHYCRPDEL